MKKLKYFLLATIGLGLVAVGMAGCGGDKGDGYDPANDHRGRVAGVYPVKVTVPMNGNFYPEMSIAKEGNHALKASASADIPGMGKMSIVLRWRPSVPSGCWWFF